MGFVSYLLYSSLFSKREQYTVDYTIILSRLNNGNASMIKGLNLMKNYETLCSSKEGISSKFPQQNISKTELISSEGGGAITFGRIGSKFQ